MQHGSRGDDGGVGREGIASFGLFGERRGAGDPAFFHIEDIQSRSALYAWRIAPHAHKRMFQLIWLASGPARAQLDGADFAVTGPCAIAAPGGVVHSFQFTGASVGHVVTVSESLLLESRPESGRDLFEGLLQAPRRVAFEREGADRALIDALIRGMANEYRAGAQGGSALFLWMFHCVLTLVRRRSGDDGGAPGRQGRRRALFSRFAALVEAHFRNDWSVVDFAEALALSAPRLNRLCREFAGKTALDLVQDRIMLEARRHLIFTGATSEMIAYELGYKDPAYFNRAFRRRMGVSPGAFRRQHMASGDGAPPQTDVNSARR